MIGLIGEFTFDVSADMVATFSNFKRDRQAVWVEHKVLSGVPKLQYIGRELDEASLTITIRPLLGVASSNVDLRISTLRLMAEPALAYPLILGLTWFGLFVIKGVDVTHKEIRSGITYSAEVNLKLKEYN